MGGSRTAGLQNPTLRLQHPTWSDPNVHRAKNGSQTVRMEAWRRAASRDVGAFSLGPQTASGGPTPWPPHWTHQGKPVESRQHPGEATPPNTEHRTSIRGTVWFLQAGWVVAPLRYARGSIWNEEAAREELRLMLRIRRSRACSRCAGPVLGPEEGVKPREAT
jgi:hypothetical protein